LAALGSPAQAQVLFSESFETPIPVAPQGPPGVDIVLPSGTWHAVNQSQPIGTTGVFTSTLFNPSPDGAQHLAMNFNSGAGTAQISTYMMSPVVTLHNGDTISFFSRTVDAPAFPDRLNLRLSTNGASTNPTDFANVLLTINPTLTTTGYPNTWTQFNATISGLSGTPTGRFAFHYDVPQGGPSGANSDFIGIDLARYTVNAVPEPGSMALCGLAAAGLGWYRRRRTAVA
jgi:hypothetical protein